MKTTTIKLATKQLEELGLDIHASHLAKTPERASRAFFEMTKFHRNKEDVLKHFVLFPAKETDQLAVISPIFFGSLCEHHMLPFFGFVHIGYIPNKQILGLSKFKRIVECVTKQLTVQEGLTEELFTLFDTHLRPKALIVVIEAKHTCLISRGAKDAQAVFRTVKKSSVFETQPSELVTFFQNIKHYE